MKTDFSRIFYDKYFSFANRGIEVRLKNGKSIIGMIIGFFKADGDDYQPKITRWHIVNENEKRNLGMAALGRLSGEIVWQKDIESVKFSEDNSVMQFCK